MVEDLGFEIITGDYESHKLWKERREIGASIELGETSPKGAMPCVH